MLPLAQIIAGLKGEIRPAEEVIDKHSYDIDFLSRSLVAAVITRMFSYMIYKGTQWGYIFVGEAIIFLYIPDDPTTVRYRLCIPQLDFQDDDEEKFHRTGVAQILAFFLNSLSTEAPPQAWHDKAQTLDTWAIEESDILGRIPERERNEPDEISYQGSLWKCFTGHSMRTRYCRVEAECNKPVDAGCRSEDDRTPLTPTPISLAANRPGATSYQKEEENASSQNEMEVASTLRIEDRPFCTHKCLLGLAQGTELDIQCPNIRDHQEKHILPAEFLSLLRIQLANDRGRKADHKPLYIKGSRGALFKVRLSSHGYTMVAKGMKEADRKHLVHESTLYDHLTHLQGIYIPVSLGIVDLELPYYYDSGIYTSMLFLSWAGRSLRQYSSLKNELSVLNQAIKDVESNPQESGAS